MPRKGWEFCSEDCGRQNRGQKLACELLYVWRFSSFRLRVHDLLFSCILPLMPSGQRRVNMVFAQLDAIRYFQPPFSVATPNRNRSLARKSGFPNTQSKDEASRTSKSCTNDSVRVDGYDVIECLDLTESPPSITLQGQAGALVWSKPAVGKSHPKTWPRTVDNSQSRRNAYAHWFDSDADFPTIEHNKRV